MAHPMLKSSNAGRSAKLRRMTENYGSASGPANNKLAPTNRLKGEGPEDAIGFGADSAPSSRGDRAGRKPALANPVPTLATGGAAIARARGGRAKKGATNVNVIVAPQGGGGAPPMPPPAPPILAGPPPGAPPMPPKPPMGAGPMGGLPPGPMPPGAPGGMPPGVIPPRARGGRVHMTAGAATGEGRLEKIGKHGKNAGKPQTV